MFRVVPDQLRISDGWVRCGQCDEVFDANAHLHKELAATEVSSPLVSGVDPSIEEPPIETHEELSVEVEDSGVNTAPAEKDGLPGDPFLEMNPHELSEAGVVDDDAVLHDFAMDVMPESSAAVTSTLRQQTDLLRFVQSTPSARVHVTDAPHSFLQSSRPTSRWQRPGVRVALVVFSALMACMLLLQVAIQERDRIAATDPATKPFLVALCDVFACKVSPLRQIESVVIDSSSFSKVQADVYRLSFALRNTAQIEIATPALELTLTDLQDQSVVRRVFAASDWGSKQLAMAPGSEISASLPISVKVTVGADRFSGYRLLAFYP
jgi:predicted Zn finger-like uncharacterized protein